MKTQNSVWSMERNVNKADTLQMEVICVSGKKFCISDTLNFGNNCISRLDTSIKYADTLLISSPVTGALV